MIRISHLSPQNHTLKLPSLQTHKGYANDVTEIMKSLPKTCQGFLMSATLSPELHKLKHVVLHSPAVLKLEEDEDDEILAGSKRGEGTLMQFYLDLPTKDKYLVLYVFLKVRDNVRLCAFRRLIGSHLTGKNQIIFVMLFRAKNLHALARTLKRERPFLR